MKKTVKYFVAKDEGNGDIGLVWDGIQDSNKTAEFCNESDAIDFAKQESADDADATFFVVRATHRIAIPKKQPTVIKL